MAPEWHLCKDNTTCISHSEICDGDFDCPTKDDEDDCHDRYVPHHEIVQCNKAEFTCTSDGVCLPLELACDGVSVLLVEKYMIIIVSFIFIRSNNAWTVVMKQSVARKCQKIAKVSCVQMAGV